MRGIDKLKRLMQDLDSVKDKDSCVTRTQLRMHVIKWCGVHRQTIKYNIEALEELKWIKYISKCRWKLYDSWKLDESSMF